MPGKKDIKVSFTASSFQYADGSNFSTAGCDLKFKHGIGGYAGICTDFKNEPAFLIDLKESNNYPGSKNFGHNVRVRTNLDNDLNTTQLRVSPLTVNLPLSRGTSVYANPHYVGKYDYKSKSWTNSAGMFCGLTQKISDKSSLSFEVQRYNLHNIKDNSGANWSFNAIYTITL